MSRIHTFRENSLPFVIAFLKGIRHLGGSAGTEEATKEWDSRHRLECRSSKWRVDGFELCLRSSRVVAESVECSDDGGPGGETHEVFVVVTQY